MSKNLAISGCHQCPGYTYDYDEEGHSWCGFADELDDSCPQNWKADTQYSKTIEHEFQGILPPVWCPLKKGPVTVSITTKDEVPPSPPGCMFYYEGVKAGECDSCEHWKGECTL